MINEITPPCFVGPDGIGEGSGGYGHSVVQDAGHLTLSAGAAVTILPAANLRHFHQKDGERYAAKHNTSSRKQILSGILLHCMKLSVQFVPDFQPPALVLFRPRTILPPFCLHSMPIALRSVAGQNTVLLWIERRLAAPALVAAGMLQGTWFLCGGFQDEDGMVSSLGIRVTYGSLEQP